MNMRPRMSCNIDDRGRLVDVEGSMKGCGELVSLGTCFSFLKSVACLMIPRCCCTASRALVREGSVLSLSAVALFARLRRALMRSLLRSGKRNGRPGVLLTSCYA